MSRIGAVVRRMYREEFNSDAQNATRANDKRGGRMRNKFTSFKESMTKRKTVIWIIRIFAVLFFLFIVAESIFQYNRFAMYETKVKARKADVEREFQRRENVIPNLVFAVSRYGTYEQGIFKDVADARSQLMTIKNPEMTQGQIGNILEKALSRLVAWAEQYPDLKATQSVQDLIGEVSNTEDRIAEAKKTYNETCEIYNQYRTVFPGNVFAFIYRYKSLPYMGIEDVNVPLVDLDMHNSEKVVKEGAEVPLDNLNKTEGAK
ncbi:MAG: LemA family protein [Planctomycetes bacterium]|nr:LemA family protein [Planctomycetota bacterium]